MTALRERVHTAVKHALRLARRNERVENIAGYEHDVYILLVAKVCKLAYNVALLFEPRRFAYSFAEVQIGCM